MASNTRVITVPLMGGLNVSSSEQTIQRGECTELINYEITTAGLYQRVKGYERFSGQPAPSAVIAKDLEGFPFADNDATVAAIKAEQIARRDAIAPPEGAGPILGVFGFKGEVYAFRNTADNTAAKMFKATGGGWLEIITPVLLPNGRYETIETNFTGSSGTREIVGVDGKNPAFRFDGVAFTQIPSTISPDAPTHVAVLPSQTLLLSFVGGTFLYSAVGDPTKFSPVDGGGEIAVGQEITGIEIQADNTAAFFCRNSTFVLYGSSSADFQLRALALKSGAVANTLQSMGSTVYLDDRGLTRLDRVQQFGDFESATISQRIQPLLSARLPVAKASMALREKNQYRLFFADRSAIVLTQYSGDIVGYTELRLTFTPSCAWSGENENGVEVYYMGGEDGNVYQMERGNSFDGEIYRSSFRTGAIKAGRQDHKHRWRKLVVEAQEVTRVDAGYKCYYDDTAPTEITHEVMQGSGTKWDVGQWDNATWGGNVTSYTDLYIDGVSRTISVYMSVESDFYPPHVMSALILHASPRGRRR